MLGRFGVVPPYHNYQHQQEVPIPSGVESTMVWMNKLAERHEWDTDYSQWTWYRYPGKFETKEEFTPKLTHPFGLTGYPHNVSGFWEQFKDNIFTAGRRLGVDWSGQKYQSYYDINSPSPTSWNENDISPRYPSNVIGQSPLFESGLKFGKWFKEGFWSVVPVNRTKSHPDFTETRQYLIKSSSVYLDMDWNYSTTTPYISSSGYSAALDMNWETWTYEMSGIPSNPSSLLEAYSGVINRPWQLVSDTISTVGKVAEFGIHEASNVTNPSVLKYNNRETQPSDSCMPFSGVPYTRVDIRFIDYMDYGRLTVFKNFPEGDYYYNFRKLFGAISTSGFPFAARITSRNEEVKSGPGFIGVNGNPNPDKIGLSSSFLGGWKYTKTLTEIEGIQTSGLMNDDVSIPVGTGVTTLVDTWVSPGFNGFVSNNENAPGSGDSYKYVYVAVYNKDNFHYPTFFPHTTTYIGDWHTTLNKNYTYYSSGSPSSPQYYNGGVFTSTPTIWPPSGPCSHLVPTPGEDKLQFFNVNSLGDLFIGGEDLSISGFTAGSGPVHPQCGFQVIRTMTPFGTNIKTGDDDDLKIQSLGGIGWNIGFGDAENLQPAYSISGAFFTS